MYEQISKNRWKTALMIVVALVFFGALGFLFRADASTSADVGTAADAGTAGAGPGALNPYPADSGAR